MAADLPPWVDIDDIAARRAAGTPDGWQAHAACRQLPWAEAEALFFPIQLPGRRRGGLTVADIEAQTVDDWCAGCSVNADCVATHVAETDGVFGSTPAQRVVIRRRLAEAGTRVGAPRHSSGPRGDGIPRSANAVRKERQRARAAR